MGAPQVSIPIRLRVRLRETYLRDFVAPTLGRGAAGVVKLDLLLRALASRPDGNRDCTVPSSYSWQELHDLIRPANTYTIDGSVGTSSKEVAIKRKWVSEQLLALERANLLRRQAPGGRPTLVVLRDDRSGESLDDPGIKDDTPYTTLHGSLFSHRRMTDWGSPQIAAYLGAMVAERYARVDPSLAEVNRYLAPGNGVWFRPLSWFADPAGYRPEHHVRIEFNEKTLSRGIKLLTQQGLMATRRTYHDPRTGEFFKSGQPRVLYFNGFVGNSPDQNGAETRKRALLRGGR